MLAPDPDTVADSASKSRPLKSTPRKSNEVLCIAPSELLSHCVSVEDVLRVGGLCACWSPGMSDSDLSFKMWTCVQRTSLMGLMAFASPAVVGQVPSRNSISRS